LAIDFFLCRKSDQYSKEKRVMLQRFIDGLLPGYLIGLEGTAQSTMEKTVIALDILWNSVYLKLKINFSASKTSILSESQI
jgi:hypothetical protein